MLQRESFRGARTYAALADIYEALDRFHERAVGDRHAAVQAALCALAAKLCDMVGRGDVARTLGRQSAVLEEQLEEQLDARPRRVRRDQIQGRQRPRADQNRAQRCSELEDISDGMPLGPPAGQGQILEPVRIVGQCGAAGQRQV